MNMRKTEIENLIAQGKHEQALKYLLDFAADFAPDLKTDIIVLQSRHQELVKQEKRRRISTAEAQDQKITLGYEILDALDSLPSNIPENNAPPTRDHERAAPTNTPVNERGENDRGSNNAQPVINITINNENRNENHINIQIETHIQALSDDVKALKETLKEIDTPEQEAAVKEVESLEQQLEGLVGAKTKDAVMPYINKVQNFLEKVEKGNDLAAKAIKGTKKGAELLGKICKNYNEVAPWVGLPKVPSILLGEKP